MSTPTARLLNLLSVMQTGGTWAAAALSEWLGASDRTLRRDVDRLRKLGYRITTVMGPDGGYRLEPGAVLPPLLLDDEQAVALSAALQVASESGSALSDASARALATVRQVLPSRLRYRVDQLTVDAIPRSGDRLPPTVDPSTLAAVGAAAHNREVLRFDYAGRDGPARRVEPHGLVAQAGRWFLAAWDLDKDDWRIFRVDRMRPRLPTRLPFTPREVPSGNVSTFVSARLKGSAHADAWPCMGSVVLDSPAAEVAPFVGDGTVEELSARRCRLTAGSWSWIALAASIGRFDVPIESAEPAELADAFSVLAERFSQAAAG
ncbi:helix-turn-helix transcriptional regulator [Paramicrobacterium agarici]|uniref:helix-turn-helix transcriptional regulator n=1 Tax=Paramicrobacterium agarici TaxID=630514 RepID=UPI0011546B8B|nr:WYL domain-containing protein [Microbacterium agarici]TQO22878.1 HTH domain-containing protein [Microbacterium agarici]